MLGKHQKRVHVCICWIVVSLCLQQVTADLDKVCTTDQSRARSPRGVCGQQLSTMLALICGPNGGYNGFDKRSTKSGLDNSFPDMLLPRLDHVVHLPGTEGDQESGIFLKRAAARSFLKAKRANTWGSSGNFQQGITCECCHNRCSISELSQYCAGRVSIMGKRGITTSRKPGQKRRVKQHRALKKDDNQNEHRMLDNSNVGTSTSNLERDFYKDADRMSHFSNDVQHVQPSLLKDILGPKPLQGEH